MRVLIVNNHDLADPTAGVTQSLRTLLRWLNEAGHPTHALTTTRLDRPGMSRSTVPVGHMTRLATTHHDESRPDPVETADYLTAFRYLLDWHRPDLVLACNGPLMIFQALAEAKRRGLTTVFALRGYGYDDPRLFAHVDHVWTCSPFLSDCYSRWIGLESTPLVPPMAWDEIAATGVRTRVTCVNPSPQKGLAFLMRLIEVLGKRRPDIPVLVVQSGQPAVAWRHPHLETLAVTATPAGYLSRTKVLLVPSVWEEPFGRVAAEAMLNGIPALVSDRGALPSLGAQSLPLPSWMTWQTRQLPSVAEVDPWVQAICALWDDPLAHHAEATRVRTLALERYAEPIVKRQHLDYFTRLRRTVAA